MKNHILLFLIALAALSASCKRQKVAASQTGMERKIDSTVVAQQKPVEMPKDTQKVVPAPQPSAESDEPKIDEIDFSYFRAKSKVHYKTAKDNYNITANIRIKKDSLIWMVITHPLAGTIAKSLITKDSVKFVDDFNKRYYLFSFADLSQQFGFKLSYDIVQSLIVGNKPFKKKGKTSRENNIFLLKQNDGRVQIDNYIGEDKKLKRILFSDQPTKSTLDMSFEDFQALNNYLFPYSSQIEVSNQNNGNDKTLVQLKHTKVELLVEPLEFPFSIPLKYERK
jgi:hypothetical protein